MPNRGSQPSPRKVGLALPIVLLVLLWASGQALAQGFNNGVTPQSQRQGAVTINAITPAPDRLARVVARQELRACIWPEYFGVTYRNSKTRQLSGIGILLALDFARELGVAVRFVDSNFLQLVDSLQQDRCDVAIHGVPITPAWQEKLLFSIRSMYPFHGVLHCQASRI